MRAFGPLHHPDHLPASLNVCEHISFGAGNIFDHSHVWEFDGEPDQGTSQECLAFFAAGAAACEPFSRPMPNPDAIYAQMCKIDGRQHDPDTGSTVGAMIEVATRENLFGSVLSTKGASALWQFISSKGPAGLALPWFQSMMLTDDDGFLVLPTKMDVADMMGGHIVMLNGTEFRDAGEFLGVNWFGPMWGVNGRFRLRFNDACRLLDLQQTIALCPTKEQYTAK